MPDTSMLGADRSAMIGGDIRTAEGGLGALAAFGDAGAQGAFRRVLDESVAAADQADLAAANGEDVAAASSAASSSASSTTRRRACGSTATREDLPCTSHRMPSRARSTTTVARPSSARVHTSAGMRSARSGATATTISSASSSASIPSRASAARIAGSCSILRPMTCSAIAAARRTSSGALSSGLCKRGTA